MKNKKVLVTGGAGFLGSALVKNLVKKGYKVTVVDKIFHRKISNVRYLRGSIKNKKFIINAFKNIEYVYHYASLAGIADCNQNPSMAVDTNIIGTLNVLEASRINRIKKIIFASTIYSLSEQGGIYKSTKQFGEMLIENYKKLYNIDYVILRFGSLYGPDSNDFNFINSAIDQAISKKKITRNGNGSEIRKYIYIDDAANASIKVLRSKYNNQYYEITGSRSIKIRSLLKKIAKRFETPIKIEYKKNFKDEDHYFKNPNTFKLRISKKLNYKNKINIDQGLKLIIDSKE